VNCQRGSSDKHEKHNIYRQQPKNVCVREEFGLASLPSKCRTENLCGWFWKPKIYYIITPSWWYLYFTNRHGQIHQVQKGANVRHTTAIDL
jgi:hypothetical protein